MFPYPVTSPIEEEMFDAGSQTPGYENDCTPRLTEQQIHAAKWRTMSLRDDNFSYLYL
jgi:hypothetical protein